MEGLTDRTSRLIRYINQLPFQIERKIIELKKERPFLCPTGPMTFGVQKAIRPDNGVPFSSPLSLFNLSKLSVWWLRIGIAIERIKVGCPQQNGRHERMHLTLKQEATKPAGDNMLQHQGIDMKVPADLYSSSPREYRGLQEAGYPFTRSMTEP